MNSQDLVGQLVGKFELQEYLGGGGMADVYRARDSVLSKTVAVKILTAESSDQDSRDRFLREARTAAHIEEHQNIGNVYDFGVHEGRPYIVMEFLRGQSLRTVIKEKRAGDLHGKLRIALQVAKAGEHIHRQNVIHRDIKPDNIHVNDSGIVKLIDFGIAKTQGLDLTQPGFVVGTVYYMAPEQALGKDITHLVDVYAFGVLLFELITGTRPIVGANFEEVFSRILHQPIDLSPLKAEAVPQSLVDLVGSCTAKDRNQRPQSFEDVRRQLESMIAGLEEPIASSVVPVRRAAADPLRRNLVVVIGLAFLLAVALGAYLYLGSRARPEELASEPVQTDLPQVLSTPSGEMVLIPEGEYLAGPDRNRASLPAFYIDRTEVTNEAFGRFCRERNSCPPGFDDARPDYPVVNITIDQAREFARWAGKRLPTFKEWEKAARGSDGREYPWGSEADLAGVANVASMSTSTFKVPDLAPAAAFSPGDSPWGVRQMVGNAWEFIDELSNPSPAAVNHFEVLMTKELKMTLSGSDSWYAMAGGSREEPLLDGVSYDKAFVPARFYSSSIGFRCVKDPE